MTKYIKFALVGDNLVYRNTGQFYNKKYSIKGNTVYGANGRKIGNIGKPTKKQSEIIEKAKQNRLKKIQKQVKKFNKTKSGDLNYKTLAQVNELTYLSDTPVSVTQQELLNLATILKEAVESGKITEEEAQSFINRWMRATNDNERTRIWKDINKFFKDKGYDYPLN